MNSFIIGVDIPTNFYYILFNLSYYDLSDDGLFFFMIEISKKQPKKRDLMYK